MPLCQYSTAGVVPGEGIHKHFLGVAAADVIGTFILAWLISAITALPAIPLLAALFVLGFLAHWLFCVDTAVNRAVYSLWRK
jgi:hypothetical protein